MLLGLLGLLLLLLGLLLLLRLGPLLLYDLSLLALLLLSLLVLLLLGLLSLLELLELALLLNLHELASLSLLCLLSLLVLNLRRGPLLLGRPVELLHEPWPQDWLVLGGPVGGLLAALNLSLLSSLSLLLNRCPPGLCGLGLPDLYGLRPAWAELRRLLSSDLLLCEGYGRALRQPGLLLNRPREPLNQLGPEYGLVLGGLICELCLSAVLLCLL